MRLVDTNKIIAFCDEWEKHFDFKNIKQVPSFLVGIWTVKEYLQSLPAEQGYISKTELLAQLDEYMKYYDLTDDYTGDDIEDAMSSTAGEIKEMIGLYPNWDKWYEEGEKQ